MSTNEQNIQALTDFHIGLSGTVERTAKEVAEIKKDSSEMKTLIVKVHTELVGDPEFKKNGIIQEGIDRGARITSTRRERTNKGFGG